MTNSANTGKTCEASGDFKVQSRFWAKVDKTEGCWNWTAGTQSKAYGAFKLHGKMRRAHCLSLIWASGPAPEDKPDALHSCDNPLCVNPAHLRWGTNKENVTDKVNRGRAVGPKGERHGCSKLTDDQVIEIRKLYGGPRRSGRRLKGDQRPTQRELASRYKVDQSLISLIVNSKKWSHL